VPFQPGRRTTNRTDLSRIGLLCSLAPGFAGEARLTYTADDGASHAYRRGERTRLRITARVEGRRLVLSVATLAEGFGPVALTPFTVNRFHALQLVVDGRPQDLQPVKTQMRLTGPPFYGYRWEG
jgi:hypothetical protein